MVFTFHILLTQRTAGAGAAAALSGVKEGYSESGIKSFTETFSYQDTEQTLEPASHSWVKLQSDDDGSGHWETLRRMRTVRRVRRVRADRADKW